MAFFITPGIAFTLLSVALLAAAIALHVSSANLLLPISPNLTLLVILLPLIAFSNAINHPRQAYAARRSASRVERALPYALQALQGVLTTALATLLLQHAMPGPAQACGLGTVWQRFFSGKDAAAIRHVQDALDCCGFNSVQDRAWPFPGGHGGGGGGDDGAGRCAARFERDTPCVRPWTEVMQRNAGLELAVVVVVGLLQVITLLASPDSGARTWRGSWWARRGWGGGDDVDDGREYLDAEVTRPLLEAPVEVVDEVDGSRPWQDSDGGERSNVIQGSLRTPSYGGAQDQGTPAAVERNAWSGGN